MNDGPAPAGDIRGEVMTHPLARSVLVLVLGLSACGSSKVGAGLGGSGPAGSGGSVGPGGTGGGPGGGAGGGSGGGAAGSGGSSGGMADVGVPADGSIVVPGAPGCGLGTAAFCDTFDRPVGAPGRAGELDHKLWSGARVQPQFPTGDGLATGILPATLPACRPGLPAKVGPDQDTLVCEPTAEVKTNHLLVAVAAQNYGQNAYRIRQPFDFAGRTGKVVFDAQGFIYNFLLGWVSVEISEDPLNAPSFSIGSPGQNNDEGGIIPRNALEVQFANNDCGLPMQTAVAVRMVNVITNYQDSPVMPKSPVCMTTKLGQLNHFELAVSQRKLEVYGTNASADGVTFEAPKLLASVDINLPFTRGYVSISTHNHASLKYSGPGGGYGAPLTDAWIARWDNVGFDGPVISNWREYEVGDALTPGKSMGKDVTNVGYLVPDVAAAPKAFTFKGVDLANVSAARLSMSAWYDFITAMPRNFVLRVRWNGKNWIDRPFTPGELGVLTGGHTLGQIGQIIDVPLADLVAGDNVLELATMNVPRGYPPAVSNLDLVLTTK
jgi:hypothetical protein